MEVYNQLFSKKFFLLVSFVLFFFNFSNAQHASGDFRTTADGFWSEYNIWEVYNGAGWVPAVPEQIPGKENAVFIKGNIDIVLDTSAVCYNLNIHKDATLNLDTAKLEVFGYLRFYNGASPGTPQILQEIATPGRWISSEEEGKLVFKGIANRTIIAAGSGGISNGLAGYNAEIDFEDNVEALISEDFRFGNLTVRAGVFTVNSSNLYLGYSAALSGNLTIMDSVVFNPPSVRIARSTVLPLESLVLDSLATLYVKEDNLVIAVMNLELNGSVIVEELGFDPIYLPTNGGIAGAATVNTYFNLYLGGATSKELTGNLVVNGLLTLTDAPIDPNGYGISYGQYGGLEYAGSNPFLTDDLEFPALNGPANLVISNMNVSLHADRTIEGQLTLNGGILGLGDKILTLGENSPAIKGVFSETNFIAMDGLGSLRKEFSQPATFFFPVGERNSDTEYTPAKITVNSGIFIPNAFVSVGLVDAKFANGLTEDNYLSRYWPLSTNIDDLNINGQFSYKTDDVSGQESSINTYYYDVASTAIPVGPIDFTQKLLKFANVDVLEDNFFISGSNHCDIANNFIPVIVQNYCGSVDIAPIVGSVAVGGTISYQWELRKDEGIWQPMGSGKDFDPTAINIAGFYEIRRVATASLCTTPHFSNIFSFHLYSEISNNTYTLLDIDEYCMIGTGFTFEGDAPTGGDGSYTYQWERKMNGGVFEVVGTDTSYTETDILLPGNYEYRRGVGSGPCALQFGDSTLVRVYNEISNNLISSTTLQYCDLPSQINITGSTHSGGGPSFTYAWERKVNAGVFASIGGNTKDLVDTDIAVTGTYQYKRAITSLICGTKNSNVFTVSVYPALSANTISKVEEVYCGNATGFSINGSAMTGGNGVFGYTWYRKKDNGASATVATNTVNYVENNNLTPGIYKYVRRVFSSACNTSSDTLIVTVLPLVSNNDLTIPDALEFCGVPDEVVLEGSLPSGGDGTYTYSWQRSIDGVPYTEVGTAQNLSDAAITVTGKYEYFRNVISATCDLVASDTLTLWVYPELSENLLSMTQQDYCSDPTGFLIQSADMTGGDGSYSSVWERSFEGGAFDTVQITNAENMALFTDIYEEAETLIPGSYTYKRTVLSSVCMNTSNIITVVIEEPLSNNTLEQPEGEFAIYCGSTPGFTLTGSTPEGGSGTYQYSFERRLDGGEWETIESNEKDINESDLNVPGIYDYRRIVSSSICDEIVSNIVNITITEPVVITATVTEHVGNELNGSIVLNVTGGLPPYDYLWTTAEFSKDIFNLAGGEYTVAVHDESGCEVSETFVVPRILGLKDNLNVLSHKLYPNPVVDILNIEVSLLKAVSFQVIIYNSVGKIIKQISDNSTDKIDLKIDMANNPSGIYFVKVVVEERTETWKFIKK